MPISFGERVARTGTDVSISLSPEMAGMDVDSLGNPLGQAINVDASKLKNYPLFVRPPGISERLPVDTPFETGVAVVDLTVPLGQGQRELVLGDRKTGKTQFLMQVLLNQAKTDTVCIYCAIGKREIEIAELREITEKRGIADKVIIIASSSSEGDGKIFLTPFTAMTVAEYFRDLGRNVFLILDDLSTHAQFYREMALTARRFPGRASYPGDIFNLHAQLLERAGNFFHKAKKRASITCMPVATSVLGDITGFITTNLMSMTDGHIYLDSEIFDQGRRPAVNPFLSVTRVGHQTQGELMRDISREITSFLIEYRSAQEYSHFGSEVSEEVKSALSRGALVYAMFDQQPSVVLPSAVITFLLAHLWAGSFRGETVDSIKGKVSATVDQFEKNANYRNSIINLLQGEKTFKGLIAKVRSQ
jgi:F-type H+-transporting ATPase subunit alpha